MSCYRLRLPATNLHDLVHRRLGQKCAGGASHAKGMHHEVVLQLCRPEINGLAGWPSYGLLKEADGPGNLSRNHGEQMPGGQVQSNTPCGRDIRRDRPVGRANHRAVPVCKPDHHLARGLRRPTKPKVEGQTCCILSPYRGSFNVSIGFNEASCAGKRSSPGMSPRAEWTPGRLILSARFVPVNDLDR